MLKSNITRMWYAKQLTSVTITRTANCHTSIAIMLVGTGPSEIEGPFANNVLQIIVWIISVKQSNVNRTWLQYDIQTTQQ